MNTDHEANASDGAVQMGADTDLARKVADLAESGVIIHDQDGILEPADYGNELTITQGEESNLIISGKGEKIRACVAGMIYLLCAPQGAVFLLHTDDPDEHGPISIFPDGSYVDILDFAAKQLRVTTRISTLLFYCSKNIALARLRFLVNSPNASYEDLQNQGGRLRLQ